MWDVPTRLCRFNYQGTVFSHVQLCESMDYSPPGSSARGIFQARILEWVAISYSRGSSQPGSNPHLLHHLLWQVGSFTTVPPGSPLTISDLCSLSHNTFCSGYSGFPNLDFDLWWWALSKLSNNHFICLPAHPASPGPQAWLARDKGHTSLTTPSSHVQPTHCNNVPCVS